MSNLETTTTVPLDTLEVRDAEDGRHVIAGICVPWATRTDLAPRPELFERGAFADLVQSNSKVKLIDYNHGQNRIPVGYSTTIEDRDGGLWTRFRLNRTDEGEGAWKNIEEGVYGGLSIGFRVPPGGDRIVNGVRHVGRARLDHVSLVEVPAYEDAVISEARAAFDAELAAYRALIAADPQMPIDTRGRKSQNTLMAEIHRRMETR